MLISEQAKKLIKEERGVDIAKDMKTKGYKYVVHSSNPADKTFAPQFVKDPKDVTAVLNKNKANKKLVVKTVETYIRIKEQAIMKEAEQWKQSAGTQAGKLHTDLGLKKGEKIHQTGLQKIVDYARRGKTFSDRVRLAMTMAKRRTLGKKEKEFWDSVSDKLGWGKKKVKKESKVFREANIENSMRYTISSGGNVLGSYGRGDITFAKAGTPGFEALTFSHDEAVRISKAAGKNVKFEPTKSRSIREAENTGKVEFEIAKDNKILKNSNYINQFSPILITFKDGKKSLAPVVVLKKMDDQEHRAVIYFLQKTIKAFGKDKVEKMEVADNIDYADDPKFIQNYSPVIMKVSGKENSYGPVVVSHKMTSDIWSGLVDTLQKLIAAK